MKTASVSPLLFSQSLPALVYSADYFPVWGEITLVSESVILGSSRASTLISHHGSLLNNSVSVSSSVEWEHLPEISCED